MGLKILHANANYLMAKGLNLILSRGGGVDKIDDCKNTKEMYEKLENEEYDIIIIDPMSNGFFSTNTAIELRKNYPNQKILVISDTGEPKSVLKSLEKGVQGYLSRQCDEDEIIHSVFAVAKGEKFYCNKVLDIILNKDVHSKESNCDATILTERENEVTALVASGLTNKEIAKELNISPHTVNTHRKNITKKLGVKSVSGLTVYALNAGLIEN